MPSLQQSNTKMMESEELLITPVMKDIFRGLEILSVPAPVVERGQELYCFVKVRIVERFQVF